MAAGIADDLATTLLLATDKKVVVAPAMNVRMWQHPATERNVAQLKVDGVTVIDPDEGEMACGEFGPGRLPEPDAIVGFLSKRRVPRREVSLVGKHVLVTAGPTHEPIDPVRVIANRSCGSQGFAIAARRRRAGARVTLVAGPVSLETPPELSVSTWKPPSRWPRRSMAALPADCAIMVAAVADWRVEISSGQAQEGRRASKAEVPADPRHPRRDFRPRAATSSGHRLRG